MAIFNTRFEREQLQKSRSRMAVVSVLGGYLLAIGALWMTGWLSPTDQEALLAPMLPALPVPASLAFLLMGASLLRGLSRKDAVHNPATGILLLLVAAFLLVLNQLPLNSTLAANWRSGAGHASLASGISILLAGLVAVIGRRAAGQRPWLFDLLLFAGLCIPLIAVFICLFDPDGLQGAQAFGDMSLLSATGFAAFFAGAALAFRDSTLSRLLFSASPGSWQCRRLLGPVLALPIALGWLVHHYVKTGELDPLLALALLAGFYTLGVLLLLSGNARKANLWFRRLNSENIAKLEAQLQLSLVMDSAMAAIFLFGEDGKLRSVNRNASHIFGWSCQEMLNMEIDDLIPPHLARGPCAHFQQSGDREGIGCSDHPQQFVGLTRDGTEVPLLVTIGKQQFGEEWLYGAVMLKAEGIVNQMYRLSREMNIDSLTRIENRYSLDNTIRNTRLHGLRENQRMAVLMLDIDHFKRINDQHGHQFGDVVLAEFAARASACLRYSDRIYRYGGEEFVVLAMECSVDQVAALAERIRANIAAEPVEHHNQSATITCSVGIAVLEEHSRDIAHCLHQADAALYQAKNNGRNRTVIYKPESTNASAGFRSGMITTYGQTCP